MKPILCVICGWAVLNVLWLVHSADSHEAAIKALSERVFQLEMRPCLKPQPYVQQKREVVA